MPLDKDRLRTNLQNALYSTDNENGLLQTIAQERHFVRKPEGYPGQNDNVPVMEDLLYTIAMAIAEAVTNTVIDEIKNHAVLHGIKVSGVTAVGGSPSHSHAISNIGQSNDNKGETGIS